MRLEARTALGAPFGAANPLPALSRPGCVVSERGDIGCVLCSAAVDAVEVTEALSNAARVELPTQASSVVEQEGRWAIWLSPRSWLLACSPEDEEVLADAVNETFPDYRVRASIFTDYLCWLMLAGDAAGDVLRQGGFISLAPEGLPAGCAKRTLLAGIPAIVFRNTASCWTIGIERARAVYFTDWLRAL